MVHTKARTGSRARRKAYAGSEGQRMAQTKALLRVLQKVQLLATRCTLRSVQKALH